MGALKEEIISWLETGAETRVDAFTDQVLAEELMRGLGYIGKRSSPSPRREKPVSQGN
jgi:hypothetical protein